MGRFEWVILFAVFIGLLVWELMRTRRDIRRARAEEPTNKLGIESSRTAD